MATDQLPKLLGVVWVDQVAQLMDHHIVSDGMRCLDDVPVKDHLPLLVAGPPTGPEVADTHPRWRDPDLLCIAFRLLLQMLQGTGAIPVLQVLLDPDLPLFSLLGRADGCLEVST